MDATRKPEAILNQQKLSDIHELALARSGGGSGMPLTPTYQWAGENPTAVMAGGKARMRDTLNAFGLEEVPLGICGGLRSAGTSGIALERYRPVVDGLEWQRVGANPAAGLFLRPGIRGLGVPIFKRQSTSSPMVPGSRHRDSSTPDREVFWSLCLYSDVSSATFREHDRAFWRSLDADYEGTWTAELPGRQAHLEAPPLRATIGGQSTS